MARHGSSNLVGLAQARPSLSGRSCNPRPTDDDDGRSPAGAPSLVYWPRSTRSHPHAGHSLYAGEDDAGQAVGTQEPPRGSSLAPSPSLGTIFSLGCTLAYRRVEAREMLARHPFR